MLPAVRVVKKMGGEGWIVNGKDRVGGGRRRAVGMCERDELVDSGEQLAVEKDRVEAPDGIESCGTVTAAFASSCDTHSTARLFRGVVSC